MNGGCIMIINGKVWILGENVDTDMIIPGKYLSSTDPEVLGAHCLEGLEKDWSKKISDGDIVIAGGNFGCGSSREHAPMALKAAGVAAILAESIGAIFYRNAVNVGLPVIEAPGVCAIFEEGHLAEVDPEKGMITNVTTGRTLAIDPFPEIIQKILGFGGLLGYIAHTIADPAGKT